MMISSPVGFPNIHMNDDREIEIITPQCSYREFCANRRVCAAHWRDGDYCPAELAR